VKNCQRSIPSLIIAIVFVLFSTSVLSEPGTSTKEQYNNILFQSNIDKDDGTEVLVREAFFPAGWKAPRHYHNGNLFIYVIEGEFEVTLEGSDKRVYTAGEALQMSARTHMDARNASSTSTLKLAVFQVGKPNAPFVVPVE